MKVWLKREKILVLVATIALDTEGSKDILEVFTHSIDFTYAESNEMTFILYRRMTTLISIGLTAV